MTRFYLVLVFSFCAGITSVAPSANAQSVTMATCGRFNDAKSPIEEAPYLKYLRAFGNLGIRVAENRDAAIADAAKKVREWCKTNAQSTFADAVAVVLGPELNEAGKNAAIGLMHNHLFASPDGARFHALELANAREQIHKFPTSSTWAMPPIYWQASFRKQPPPIPDGPNIWFPIGPQPISFSAAPGEVWGAVNAHETGRVISLAVAPQGQIFAGGEFGGVWLYAPSSSTWAPLTDDQISPQIGAIALDPANWQTIYAGTGENSSAAACGGNVFAQGILKSTNGGTSWVVVGSSSLAGAGVSRILVGSGVVLAATSGGIFVSSDGGNTWNQTYQNCATDMAFSTASATTIYAATQSGIIVSTNSGTTWNSTTITQPTLPPAFGGIYHIAIGVSLRKLSGSTATDVIYASIAGNGCRTWAAYMSPNGGQSWTNLGLPATLGNGWCNIGHANALAVDPANSDIAAFGGDWPYIYDASAKVWNKIGISAVAHSDTRALAFDGSEHLYVGNDGGVWEVPDASAPNVGIGLNDGGLQVTEFYPGLGLWNHGGTLLIAGSQDNGTESYSISPGILTWNGVIGADGGAAAIDQNNVQNMFAETLDPTGLNESTDGKNWQALGTPSGFEAGWNFPLAISPAPPGYVPAPTALYIGCNGIYELTADSSGQFVWTTLSQAFPVQLNPNPYGCTAVSLRTDPLNPSHVFAGWYDGTLNFSTDSGNTWVPATTSQKIVGGITAIAISPGDPYSIAVTTAAGHLWVGSKVNTSSPIWQDDTGNLPVVQGIGLNAVIYSAGGLMVASDSGVFEQQGGIGGSWATLGEGLPNTKIEDLQWSSGDLIAITYGRGAWEVSQPTTGASSNTNCQLVGKYNLCYLRPTILNCATNYAICHPVCDFPCNNTVVTWVPQAVSGDIDPWLDGTTLNVLAVTAKQAQGLASVLQVTMSTEARTQPISQRMTNAQIDDRGGLSVESVLIVGPSIEVSYPMNLAPVRQDAVGSASNPIIALSLPYEYSEMTSTTKVRMVKFDGVKGRWVDVGAQSASRARHVITARISGAGKYAVVAEVPATHH